MIDLRQLEIIRAIADSGSFTAAGNKLHVSQSAVSRQILLLEEELGEPVFLRIGRKIRITPAGESLLQLSHRVFQDLTDTVAGIADSRESLHGTLRLAGGMTVCLYIFPPLLTDLRRVHPHLDPKVSVVSGERCVAQLRAGPLDLGLVTLPLHEPDLVSVPLLREELMIVTDPKHPLAKKRRGTPAALNGEAVGLFETGANTRRVVDEFFVTQHLQPRIVMETENVEIIKAMVRTALGISIIPYVSVAREVASGHLFCA